ncbi:GNAT family N-acetyltransferase [Proteus mirabilis]|uniref:GNAT family N-acetyltransferase n=1 Tax=Proteus mirabilis TaxID=584 RepID=UPI00228FC622|nr:GNAT family N-acetyltransferase [Proteus mirabilis]MDC5894574.1 GNAT family N-acetyltransferase [Proteus mirabilis]MDC5915708.1 GNAT family N-acetyltransferase [Proteus mirabilis]MDC5926224.1 GNAT family N-acetyltransferase [Proteus mirabilis]MDC6011210.1 GNAT family N-acetyltransferase [Proteus mirabilis]MDC6021783.1 GNAT family N-acetyltransferase [Proteus mirabilis]
MEIKTPPQQKHIAHLQKLLNNENKTSTVGIVDLKGDIDYWQVIALENGEAVGLATIQFGNELYKLYVAPNYRNKNVADKLVNYVMGCLKNNGETEMFIEMTQKSLPFWGNFIKKNQLKYNVYEGQLKADIILK